jgi:hypothetical protein
MIGYKMLPLGAAIHLAYEMKFVGLLGNPHDHERLLWERRQREFKTRSPALLAAHKKSADKEKRQKQQQKTETQPLLLPPPKSVAPVPWTQRLVKPPVIPAPRPLPWYEKPYVYREFPKWKYSAFCSPVIVQNATEEVALGPYWFNAPSQVQNWLRNPQIRYPIEIQAAENPEPSPWKVLYPDEEF